MGKADHLTHLLRNLHAGQEATVRTGHGTTNWFQIGKEYIKSVYCHPANLTYVQSTSWETLGWRKHKLESRLPGEISITSDMQMTPPLWQNLPFLCPLGSMWVLSSWEAASPHCQGNLLYSVYRFKHLPLPKTPLQINQEMIWMMFHLLSGHPLALK